VTALTPRTARDRRDLMTQDKDRRDLPPQAPARRVRRKPETAFDQWLARGLHQMFDEVAKEPIPEELLKLIEEDKQN
jgi:anti-sigma factor NepR-like protein